MVPYEIYITLTKSLNPTHSTRYKIPITGKILL